MEEFSMSTKESVMQRNTQSTRVRTLAACGMFAAIAAVLMFIEIPLPIAPSFYKLDFSEVPVMIGTFCYGPIAGIAIEFIKIAVKTVIKGTQTAFVGEFANFLIGCSLVVPAGIIYQWKKTKKSAIIGMATGTIITAIVGCFINAFVLLPTYATAFGMPVEAIVGMGTAINASVTDLATFAILLVAPFNIVKGVLVSFVTFLLYKRISGLVKGAKY